MAQIPKVITGLIEFEVAKTEIENKGLSIKITSERKMRKKAKKLIRLTTKYLIKLMKLHYDQAKVRFDDTEFVVDKYPQSHHHEDKGE